MRYSKQTMNRFLDMRFIGEMDIHSRSVGYGMVGSAACGDIMKLFLLIENDTIKDVRIKIFGCTSAYAAAVYLAELCLNRTMSEIMNITNRSIAKFLALPKIKYHCSVIAQEALESAINDYSLKNNLGIVLRTAHYEETKTNDNKAKSDIALVIELPAFRRIVSGLQEKKESGFLIIVKEGVCGIQYDYKLSSDIQSYESINYVDFYVLYESSVRKYIDGLVISFVSERLDSYFVFKNSFARGECECRASISF